MQPPPRKGTFAKVAKNLHSEQLAKLQAKNQQECDLLEDIRNFTKQRSSIEKSYGEALCKIAANYQNKKIACVPDIRLEDGSEAWNIYSVWRTVLDETEKLGKARLAAVEVFHQRISEDAKQVRHEKIILQRKLSESLNLIQKELQLQIHELDRTKRFYYAEENVAHDAREKATDAETKLKRKKGSLFQSISSLQKNSAKFTAKKELCDEKSSGARNDYILALAASNAHQRRYYEIDFERIQRTMEHDMYEKISEYLTLMSRTELLTCTASQNSYTRIKEQASTITRGYNLRCYLTFYPMLGHSIQYDFEPCKGDPIDKIMPFDDGSLTQLNAESKKCVALILRECNSIKEAKKKIHKLQASQKADRDLPAEVESKIEDLRHTIRRGETLIFKAETKLEFLRDGGIEVEEYSKSLDTDSLGADLDAPLSRTGSTVSVKEETPSVPTEHEENETMSDNTAEKQYSVDSVDAEHPEYQHQPVSQDSATWDPISVDWGDAPVSPLPPVTNGATEDIVYPKCIVLYNYEGQNADELTIVENEELELVSEGDGDGWIQARNYKGEIGYIPQNYVEMEDAANASTTEPAPEPVVDETYTSSTSYFDQELGEEFETPLSFSAIDYTYEAESIDYGQDENSYGPPTDLPPPPPPTITATTAQGKPSVPVLSLSTDEPRTLQQYCRAVYDYEATCPEELSFEEDQVIRILKKTVHDIDDGWWEGSIDGEHGLFPSLVVEECRPNGEPFTPDATSLSSPCTTPPPHTPPEVPGFLLPPERVIITQPTPDVETVEEAMALQEKKKEEAEDGTPAAVSYYYETPNFELELSGEQQEHYHRQFSSSPESEATTEKDQQYAELVSSPDVSNQDNGEYSQETTNETLKDVSKSPVVTPDTVEELILQEEGKNNQKTAPVVNEIKDEKSEPLPIIEEKVEKVPSKDLGVAQIIVTAATPMKLEQKMPVEQEDSRAEADQQSEEQGESDDIEGEAIFLEDDRPPPPPPAPDGGGGSNMMRHQDDRIDDRDFSVPLSSSGRSSNDSKTSQMAAKPQIKQSENPKERVGQLPNPGSIESETLESAVPTPKSPSLSDGPPDLDPEKLKSLDKIKESIA